MPLVTSSAIFCVWPNDSMQQAISLYHLSDKTTFEIRNPRVILDILQYAIYPKTADEICAYIAAASQCTEDTATRLLTLLVGKSILVERSEEDRCLLSAALQKWHSFGWGAAAFYHYFTRDFPFLDYSRQDAYYTDQSLMTHYKSLRPEPDRYKDYPDTELFVPLPVVHDVLNDVSLHNFQDGMRSKPQPSALTTDILGTILFYTFGRTGSIKYPVVEPLLRKCSPSGGARHPTEGYLAIFDVQGIAPGLYHYSVRREGLELISRGQYKDFIFDLLHTLNEREDMDPKAIIFFASLVERNMWRYREPRTFRVTQLDIGHATWTSQLVSAALGIKIFGHHGMDAHLIEALYGLDPTREPFYWYSAIE